MPIKKEDNDNFTDLAITGFTISDPPKVVKVNTSEVEESGYCQKCKKRYSGVPVINGIAICPNCTK